MKRASTPTRRARTRAWHERNREHRRRYLRLWRLRNPAKMAAYQERQKRKDGQ